MDEVLDLERFRQRRQRENRPPAWVPFAMAGGAFLIYLLGKALRGRSRE